jgi:hypothetical protein
MMAICLFGDIMKRKFGALLLALLMSQSALMARYMPTADAAEPASPSFLTLPVKPQDEVSQKRIKRAKLLSQWVLQTLDKEQVKVAIISRLGSPLAVLFDKTGMTHSGYVFRNPETGQWITYSLYSDPEANYKKSLLWQQSIPSFYYGQSGRRTDTLMLIPPMDLQEKLLARLMAQPFEPLLPADEHYSLVAPLESPQSFNCTKWILLQLFAAKENSSDTPALLKLIREQYHEPVTKPFFLVRYVLKRKPDVNWDELSPPNHIHTVTVNSLYQSPYFEKKRYYHDK